MSKVRHLRLDTKCSLRHFRRLDPPILLLFLLTFRCLWVNQKVNYLNTDRTGSRGAKRNEINSAPVPLGGFGFIAYLQFERIHLNAPYCKRKPFNLTK